MRIAILHYHLQTGGVTRVIEHTATALIEAGHQVLVLAGEAPDSPLPEGTRFICIPELAYEERRPTCDGKTLVEMLFAATIKAFDELPDIWHIHNHSLGKNLAMAEAVLLLAEAEQRLLLQIHDFAEDGRPVLYRRMCKLLANDDPKRLGSLLYPLAPQIHYAVLNERDRWFLSATDIPMGQLHLLPNAVAMPKAVAPKSPIGNKRLWLYPTRAIRRKNLGELLLWAALAGDDDVFATTQAPKNPAEQERYQSWVALAGELGLKVEFELGTRVKSFSGLLASAHAMVTTSVGEGFGLAFLEPWLFERPLAGRNLPEITRDFRSLGLDLDNLYPRLDVPLAWIDETALRHQINGALHDHMGAYGRESLPHHTDLFFNAAVVNGRIDFGRLDEVAQAAIIRRLARTPRDQLSLNPQYLRADMEPARIHSNRRVAERDYSIEGYARRLLQIYERMSASKLTSHVDHANGTKLLDRFLDPQRLFLLRT